MKIIRTDNFNRDYISEILIAENVNKYYVKDIVELLNKQFSGSASTDYFEYKENNYELYKFKS